MAASTALRKAATSALQGELHGWQGSKAAVSIAEKLTQQFERKNEIAEKAEEERRVGRTAEARQEVTKSFPFHLGAVINMPTSELKSRPVKATSAVEASEESNPFAGLPLQAWAERLGERVMPAYELIKEEQQRAKTAAKPAAAPTPSISVPHLLPITRWAANSKTMKDTFIADDTKSRKKARLSWYHPDDTMVPRDWFRGGLLEDLKYYSPFRISR